MSTKYGAYDKGLPCKNSSCKSNGRPHPNCNCYPGLAEGGEVVHFCSEDRPHKSGCQYFADGGVVVPDSEVVPDVTPTPISSKSGDVVPDKDVTPDPTPTVASKPGDIVPDSEVIPDETITKDYSTTGQKILTGIEGASEGVLGFVSPAIEKGLSKLGVPGLSNEDIKGREKANPLLHGAAEVAGFGASMYFGIGEAKLAMEGANLLTKGLKIGAETGELAKLGIGAIKSFTQGAAFATNDVLSKGILGEYQDLTPTETASSALLHVGAGGLFNMGISGGFSLLGNALGRLPNIDASKVRGYVAGVGAGTKIEQDIAGVDPKVKDKLIGQAKQAFENMLERNPTLSASDAIKGFEHGLELRSNMTSKVVDQSVQKATQYTGTAIGSGIGGPLGTVAGAAAGTVIGKATGPIVSKIFSPLTKPAASLTIKAFPTIFKNIDGTWTNNSVNYLQAAAKGENALGKAIEASFKASASKFVTEGTRQRDDAKKLQKYLEDGGFDKEITPPPPDEFETQEDTTQGFAEGGEVQPQMSSPPTPSSSRGVALQPNGIDTDLPDHNVALQSMKAKAFNYLNTMRPQANVPKLAFDSEPDNRLQKKSYDRACEIAVNPLSVMDHIAKGTLEPEHVKHLAMMYPDAFDHMKKKVTERITQAQMKGEKPSYKARQGMSLFLGVPLDSSFDQKHMAAAQAVFQQQGQQGAKAQGGDAKFSELKKADNRHATGSQARELRQQKG